MTECQGSGRLKGRLGLDPKRLCSLTELTEYSENQDFLMIHQRLPTLPLWGVQPRYAGLCMGKVLKGKKKNAFFFP